VKRSHRFLLIAALALLPILVFTELGLVDWYSRMEDADVRVDGLPAGYIHRGRVSAIVTRTDIVGRHSYRIWPIGKDDALIFDCHHWIAPDRKLFVQGHISAPCSNLTSGTVTSPESPVTHGITKDKSLRFTTRDGKVISMRAPY
jgi:hypothetical protein